MPYKLTFYTTLQYITCNLAKKAFFACAWTTAVHNSDLLWKVLLSYVYNCAVSGYILRES